MELESDYYLSFQKNREFHNLIGKASEREFLIRDKEDNAIPFYQMENNAIHSMKPLAGLYAYLLPKGGNKFDIIYIGESENFSETLLPDVIQKAFNKNYYLFIAIASGTDTNFRQSVVGKLLEQNPIV